MLDLSGVDPSLLVVASAAIGGGCSAGLRWLSDRRHGQLEDKRFTLDQNQQQARLLSEEAHQLREEYLQQIRELRDRVDKLEAALREERDRADGLLARNRELEAELNQARSHRAGRRVTDPLVDGDGGASA